MEERHGLSGERKEQAPSVALKAAAISFLTF
jgi:hypothetical protein